jgi:hypothetical protein
MKKTILIFIISLLQFHVFCQEIETIEHCNCEIKVDQISPTLNGDFELICNNKTIETGQFINDAKDGEWITYSTKGKIIRKINYKNGLLNGKSELFYVNGNTKVSASFEKGNKTGKWTYYTIDGNIRAEGNYKDNEPIGIWTINNKKGKSPATKYDFDKNEYTKKKEVKLFKETDFIQNENTENWYILIYPEKEYNSSTKPLGGFDFTNCMIIELLEIPTYYWNTHVYYKYKIDFNIDDNNSTTFECRFYEDNLPKELLEFTFLTITSPPEEIKDVEHSNLEKKLLEYKINEAISLLPPWIKSESSNFTMYLHYVLNINKK